MNIIILAKNREKYISGYYHQDIINAFKKVGNCYLYGENYPKYDKNDNIEDVIAKSPFNKQRIDLIVVGTSWESENSSITESDPHPRINLRKINIIKIFFLNKEYKNLDKKLKYAKDNNFDYVFTAHHDYKKWANQTGLRFFQLLFAADPNRFKDYELSKKYDFGFTGALHRDFIDIRYKIKYKLFKNPEIKSYVSRSILFEKKSLKESFKEYKIYWAEWGAKNFLGRNLLPYGNDYVKFLNSFKVFLNTPSAIGIINTRYFECLAVKTLLFCPETKYYVNTFKDNYNCVMFKENLSDFEQKLEDIINDERKRHRIIENGYKDFIINHTYDKRVETVLNILKINFNRRYKNGKI